jgi:hypothetical protein
MRLRYLPSVLCHAKQNRGGKEKGPIEEKRQRRNRDESGRQRPSDVKRKNKFDGMPPIDSNLPLLRYQRKTKIPPLNWDIPFGVRMVTTETAGIHGLANLTRNLIPAGKQRRRPTREQSICFSGEIHGALNRTKSMTKMAHLPRK